MALYFGNDQTMVTRGGGARDIRSKPHTEVGFANHKGKLLGGQHDETDN